MNSPKRENSQNIYNTDFPERKEEEISEALKRRCVFCEASLQGDLCSDCNMHQVEVWEDGLPLRDDFHRYGPSPLNDPKDFGLEIVAEQVSDYSFPGDHSYELVVLWQNPTTGELRAALDYGHQAPDIFAALTWKEMKPIREVEDLRSLVDTNFPNGIFDSEKVADFRNAVSGALFLKQMGATSSRLTNKGVHLDPERKGYWYEGVFREGFLDDLSLSIGDRRLVAGWARALTPNAFEESQRELLKRLPPGESMSEAQGEAGALHHLLWGSAKEDFSKG